MRALFDQAPGMPAARLTVVMLPGARDRAQDIVDHGFVRAVRRRALPVDVVVADAHADYYVDGSLLQELERDIIDPLRRERTPRVVLMGISLGGLGALAYARERPAAVASAVLIAPFLASRGLVAEVAGAGGLKDWRPGAFPPEDDERSLMAWLKDGDPVLSRVYVGYGTEDRYVAASRLLEGLLPGGQVVAVRGGHDWPTWLALWERLLDAGAVTVLAADAT